MKEEKKKERTKKKRKAVVYKKNSCRVLGMNIKKGEIVGIAVG